MVAGGKAVFVVFLAFKMRVTEIFRVLEEKAKGSGQMSVLLNQRLIVHLSKKGKFFFIFGRGGNEVQIRGCIEFLLVFQHFIPDTAAAVKGFPKQLLLLFTGVQAHPDCVILKYLFPLQFLLFLSKTQSQNPLLQNGIIF